MKSHHKQVHGESLSKEKVECQRCGELFKKRSDHVEKHEKHFCSRKCKHGDFKYSLNCSRDGCNKEFKAYRYQIERGGGKYCSYECSGKAKRVENPVDNTYTAGWKKAREKRLEKDNYECQNCGSEENLEVHHINKYRLFEDKEEANQQRNLITLCTECHNRHEFGDLEIDYSGRFTDLKTEDVLQWLDDAETDAVQEVHSKIEEKVLAGGEQ